MKPQRKTIDLSIILIELNNLIQELDDWKPVAHKLKELLQTFDVYNGFRYLASGKPLFLSAESRDKADLDSWSHPFTSF